MNLERWYLLVPGVIVMLLPSLVIASVIIVFSLLIMVAEPFKILLRNVPGEMRLGKSHCQKKGFVETFPQPFRGPEGGSIIRGVLLFLKGRGPCELGASGLTVRCRTLLAFDDPPVPRIEEGWIRAVTSMKVVGSS